MIMANGEKIIAIIPARYSSTRLPGKPLADINGRPLIEWVWRAVQESKLIEDIYIAVDDKRVEEAYQKFGAKAVMTDADIQSGTDRIFAVCESIGIRSGIIVNIQGDEPLLKGTTIDKLIENFKDSDASVGTLVKKIESLGELLNPSVVKAVVGKNNRAITFSRSPIPFIRDYPPEQWLGVTTFWKHIGIYAYKYAALRDFVSFPVSNLENLEKLEQLRLIERAYHYLCVETEDHLIGVDTPEDLDEVSKYLHV
jgi:3-deoxy-manno-octulosonate cytidylyltransferase (CMP-KDO synthetase)